jgi:hypothetical protein
MRAQHERERDDLLAIEPDARAKSEAGNQMPLRVLRWGVALNEFHADWCTRTEAEIAQETAPKTSRP